MIKLLTLLVCMMAFAGLAFADDAKGNTLTAVNITSPANGTINATNHTIEIEFYLAGNLTNFNLTTNGTCALYVDSLRNTTQDTSNSSGANVTFKALGSDTNTYVITSNGSETDFLGETNFNYTVGCCAAINSSLMRCVNSTIVDSPQVWIDLLDPRIFNLTVNQTNLQFNNRTLSFEVNATNTSVVANVTLDGLVFSTHSGNSTCQVNTTTLDLKRSGQSCNTTFTATITSIGGRTNTTNVSLVIVPCINMTAGNLNVTIISNDTTKIMFSTEDNIPGSIEVILPSFNINATNEECPYSHENATNMTYLNFTNQTTIDGFTCSMILERTVNDTGNVEVKFDESFSSKTPSNLPIALVVIGSALSIVVVRWALSRRAT